MDPLSIKTGYGPKSLQSAEKRERTSFSFLKLIKEKITFEDKASMRHIITQIVTSLHAESPIASALFAGHEFIDTNDNETTFSSLMKEGKIADIRSKNFVEQPPGKAEPKVHYLEDDSSSGEELFQADLMVRAILSLQATPETAERLSTFRTGVEQIEYLRLEIELKVLNATTVLHQFLRLKWSKKFKNFRSWASHIMTEFRKIDWEHIDQQDILNFVLMNAGPRYEACMKEIYLNHQGASFTDICERVSLYEEAQKVINNLSPPRNQNQRGTPNWRRQSQNAYSVEQQQDQTRRSDGSRQRCTICNEYGHRYDQCPNITDPQNAEARRTNYRNRSQQQNRNRNRNRQNRSRDEHSENARQILALQNAVQQLMRQSSNSANAITTEQANVVTQGHWSGLTTTQSACMISGPTEIPIQNTDNIESVRKSILELNQEQRNKLLSELISKQSYHSQDIDNIRERFEKLKKQRSETQQKRSETDNDSLEDSPVDIGKTYENQTQNKPAVKLSGKTEINVAEKDPEDNNKNVKIIENSPIALMKYEDAFIELPTSQIKPIKTQFVYKIKPNSKNDLMTTTDDDLKMPPDNDSKSSAEENPGEQTASAPTSPFDFHTPVVNMKQNPWSITSHTMQGTHNDEDEETPKLLTTTRPTYNDKDEEMLMEMLINKRTKALQQINEQIAECKTKLNDLEQQRSVFRMPISDLLQRKYHAHAKPNYHRPKITHQHDTQKQKYKPNKRGKIPAYKPAKFAQKKMTLHQHEELAKIKRRMNKPMKGRKAIQERSKQPLYDRHGRQALPTSLDDLFKYNPNVYMVHSTDTSINQKNTLPLEKFEAYLDSGATKSYVNSLKWISQPQILPQPVEVGCALSGKTEIVNYYGTLPNGMVALYAPNFHKNLISAKDITQHFGNVTFTETDVHTILFGKRITIAHFSSDSGQYEVSQEPFFSLQLTGQQSNLYDKQNANAVTMDQVKLHFRQTGAPGMAKLRSLHRHITGFPVISLEDGQKLYNHHDVIKTIATTRQIATSFKRTPRSNPHPEKRTYHFLERLHIDTAHEYNHPSISGHKCWDSVKDYATKYGWTLPLRELKDIHKILPKFLTDIQNHCGMPVRIVRTDNHQCYKHKDIQTYFQKHGITHETTIPDTSQQNGFVEISIRFIREKARSLLEIAKLPVELWNFAIIEAARIINMLPTSANPENMSPYQMASGAKPDISQLVVFGSIAWTRLDPTSRTSKMNPVAKPYIYIGLDRKGYILWDPRLTRGTKTNATFATFHAVHVTFDQTCTWTTSYIDEIATGKPISRTKTTIHHQALLPDRFSFENGDSDSNDTPDFRIEEHCLKPNPSIFEGSTNHENANIDDTEESAHSQKTRKTKTKANLQGSDDIKGSNDIKGSTNLQGRTDSTPVENPLTQRTHDIDQKVITKTKETLADTHSPSSEQSQDTTYRSTPTDNKIKITNPHQTRSKTQQIEQMITRGKLRAKINAAKQKRQRTTNSDRHFGTLQANVIIQNKVSWMPAKLHYEVGVDEACRIPLPRNLKEALEHPQWREAIDKEIASVISNQTFTFEDRTVSHAKSKMKINNKTIRTHFVFKAKPDCNGKLLKLKARLVANGNNQEEGINYFASYAPVASTEVIKMQVANALYHDMTCESWDYSSAYLQGTLDEIIYISFPGNCADYGIIVPPNARIRLLKSIYGLVQAGNVWNKLLTKSITKAGFTQCEYEPCLFIQNFPEGHRVIITTYVDDLLVSGTSNTIMDELFDNMSNDLKIGNREKLQWHLGMHFEILGHTCIINQASYIIEIINEFNMQNCKARTTPKKLELELTKSDAPQDPKEIALAQQLPYRRIIGKTMHLARMTRADISEAVADCSKFLSNWGEKHWAASKDIIRYLKGSHDLPLVYEAKQIDESPLHVYVDAAYAKDLDDRKSQTGISIFYYNCLVYWKSKKQKLVSQSSCEAEYVALAEAANQTIHLRRIANFIDPNFDMDIPTTVYEDNQGTIALAHSDGKTNARTKHIDVRIHKVREYIKEGVIQLKWVDTQNQRADFFTKPLSGPKHNYLRNLNMNCDAYHKSAKGSYCTTKENKPNNDTSNDTPTVREVEST